MPYPVSDNSALARLSRFMRRISLGFSLATITVYLGFNLAVVYAPRWLGEPIGSNTIVSRGIVIGLLLIVIAIITTSLFVYIINRRGDELQQEVRRERQI